MALSIGVLGILLISRLSMREDRDMKWMTHQEMTRITRGGPLTRLKWKLLRLLGPLGRFFTASKTQIWLDFKFISLTPGAAGEGGLPSPVSTNADGSAAWVIANKELGPLEHTLKKRPSGPRSAVGGSRITTYDGGQATLYMGSARVVGTNVPAGQMVDVLPKTANGAIRLLVGVTSVDEAAPPPEGSGGIKTNISVACQSFIPNNGGLVLAGKEMKAGGGRVYWVIIHVLAVDAKGRPLKL